MVWGIGSEDALATLQAAKEQMGLTYPILYDEGATVKASYNPGDKATNSMYPQDWIVGVDGTIIYVSTVYDPTTMIALIEGEIAKMNR